MLKWQKDLIEKTQCELLRQIRCSQLFLSNLVAEGSLTPSEKDSILMQEKNNPDSDAHVGFLLKILTTRTDGFDRLWTALAFTSQTGALKILQDNAPSFGGHVPEIPASDLSKPESTESSLIVGNPDCSYRRVMDVLEDGKINDNLLRNWKGLASKLEIKPDRIRHLERQITIESSSTLYVIQEILMSWRCAASENAKLTKLISVMESLDCTAIADKLKQL